MNKFKKLLSLTMVSSLILTACSLGSNQGISAKEKKEIVKKFYDNFSTAKSFKAKTDTTLLLDSHTLVYKIEAPFVEGSKEVEFKQQISVPPMDGDEKVDIRLHIVTNKGTTYMSSPDLTSGEWIKTSDPELVKVYSELKDFTELFELKDLFKEDSSKISVEEINGKYKLTYKEIDENAQYIIAKNFDSQSKKLSFFEEYETKFDGSFTFTVNKETLQVESLEFSATSKDPAKKLVIKSNSTFTDVNKTSEVTLPDEAKNAQLSE